MYELKPYRVPNSAPKCSPAEAPVLSSPNSRLLSHHPSDHISPLLLLTTSDVTPSHFPPSLLPLHHAFAPPLQRKSHFLPPSPNFPFPMPGSSCSPSVTETVCLLFLHHYTDVGNKSLYIMFNSANE